MRRKICRGWVEKIADKLESFVTFRRRSKILVPR